VIDVICRYADDSVKVYYVNRILDILCNWASGRWSPPRFSSGAVTSLRQKSINFEKEKMERGSLFVADTMIPAPK
jgi:hypothetical protein